MKPSRYARAFSVFKICWRRKKESPCTVKQLLTQLTIPHYTSKRGIYYEKNNIKN